MGQEEATLNAWPGITTGKEFRVLSSNGHCREISSQVTELLLTSDLNLWHVSVTVRECVIRTTTNTHGNTMTQICKNYWTWCTNIPRAQKPFQRGNWDSGHHRFVVCWNGSCWGATVSGLHGFGQSRSIQWLLPKQSSYKKFCYLRFKQRRKSFPSLQGFLYTAVREIGN